MYLLTEFMAGGDLYGVLTDKGKFTPAEGRFYGAEVLCGLNYIHSHNYVYRDLKPENILISASGHAKIADLGFCKHVSAGERTYTVCGTADYMAPEVMLCRGYDKSADYWAFGVLIYEMLVGSAPFAANSDRERHQRILTATIAYPADFPSAAKDLVKRTCMLDVSHRLGMMARGVQARRRRVPTHSQRSGSLLPLPTLSAAASPRLPDARTGRTGRAEAPVL